MANQNATTAGKTPRAKHKSVVKSAVRTLALFEVFAHHQEPLSLSELARALEIPLSSCHGLVGTLQNEGYLYSFGERRQYYPTKRLLEFATAITNNDPTLELLAPYLEALRDLSGETVIVGTRQNLAVLYLDVVEGTQTIRYSASAGDVKPLHSSAIGKAMLSELSPAKLLATLNKIKRPKITPNTIVDPKKLTTEIKAGRQRGYFVTRGENVADVWAVAKTAHVAGEMLGIAIAGPAHRMKKKMTEHTKSLANCCATMEENFHFDTVG